MTWIHDVGKGWFTREAKNWYVNGAIDSQEDLLLNVDVGTCKLYQLVSMLQRIFSLTYEALELPQFPYENSIESPDAFYHIDGNPLPTVALECGWDESSPRLHNGKNLLLTGGNGLVNIVLLIVWSKDSKDRVRGVLEVFKRDPNGMPLLVQIEVCCF